MSRTLPDWLRLCFQSALIGEVYSEVRAIAVAFSDKNEMKARYYLDREPTDFDFDSLGMVVGYVLEM